MELQNGRPAGADRRQPREARVYDYLDGLGIEYQRVDHAPAQTMEDCKAIDEVLGTAMCKNLFLCNRQKTNFYLLLMPADKPFKTKELSAQINAARLSFASEEYMLKYLDILPGAVSVLGLMNDGENDGRHRLPSLRQHLQPEIKDGRRFRKVPQIYGTRYDKGKTNRRIIQ